MKFLLVFFILFSASSMLIAQENSDKLVGKVSYTSGQNIYIKFKTTANIENGDTLFINQENQFVPALIVQHKSSISCLCNAINKNNFAVGDQVFAKSSTLKNQKINNPTAEQAEIEQDVNAQALTSDKTKAKKPEQKSDVSGRLSLSSYSNFSNASNNKSYRFRYTFSMLAQNVSDSKLSAETYISFTHKLNEWNVVQDDLNNALKIYSLALRYDFNASSSLWAGRKINPRIANIGAVDGIQFQKSWNDFYVGAVVGTHPDYTNYGFNPDLLEYGGYIGHNSKTTNGYAQSSLAFFEQRNKGNIDRRFVYFQHSSTLLKNLNLFSSFELDLYKLENGLPKNTLSLTSLYLSLRYRVSRKLALFGSYDNRKNVIYYETFRNYTDEILQQASRQGYRLRITYRPINYLNLGIDGGTRFREGDLRRNNTVRGYATYTQLPHINASLTVSANLIQNSYLDGQVFGARLTKNLLQGKLYSMLNYRWVKFDYLNTASQIKQNISEIDLSYQVNKKLYFSVNFETTFQEGNNYSRVYLNLRKRF